MACEMYCPDPAIRRVFDGEEQVLCCDGHLGEAIDQLHDRGVTDVHAEDYVEPVTG